MRVREGHREQRIGAEPRLVVRAVEFQHAPVDARLVGGVSADQRIAQLGVDVLHGLQHALAEEAHRVAVTQLDGLARAGRRARRHRGAAHRAVLEFDIGLHGRVAAGVDDLAAPDVDDAHHELTTPRTDAP